MRYMVLCAPFDQSVHLPVAILALLIPVNLPSQTVVGVLVDLVIPEALVQVEARRVGVVPTFGSEDTGLGVETEFVAMLAEPASIFGNMLQVPILGVEGAVSSSQSSCSTSSNESGNEEGVGRPKA